MPSISEIPKLKTTIRELEKTVASLSAMRAELEADNARLRRQLAEARKLRPSPDATFGGPDDEPDTVPGIVGLVTSDGYTTLAEDLAAGEDDDTDISSGRGAKRTG